MELAHSKIFEVSCNAVHKVLSEITSYVCDSLPDEPEVFLGEENCRKKHKRTGRYHYKLRKHWQLNHIKGRNRRGWKKPWKEPKRKIDRKWDRLMQYHDEMS